MGAAPRAPWGKKPKAPRSWHPEPHGEGIQNLSGLAQKPHEMAPGGTKQHPPPSGCPQSPQPRPRRAPNPLSSVGWEWAGGGHGGAPVVRVLGRVGGYWWGSGATCWAEGTAPPPAGPKKNPELDKKRGAKSCAPFPTPSPRLVVAPPAPSATQGCQAGCWQQVAPCHQPGG